MANELPKIKSSKMSDYFGTYDYFTEHHDYKTPFCKGHDLRKEKKAKRRNSKKGKKANRTKKQ